VTLSWIVNHCAAKQQQQKPVERWKVVDPNSLGLKYLSEL
jgi:hypothetical protein